MPVKLIEAAYIGGLYSGFTLSPEAILVVRRADKSTKIVKGSEARLADALLWETGCEERWDSILAKLSGKWQRQSQRIAISDACDHAAIIVSPKRFSARRKPSSIRVGASRNLSVS